MRVLGKQYQFIKKLMKINFESTEYKYLYPTDYIKEKRYIKLKTI